MVTSAVRSPGHRGVARRRDAVALIVIVGGGSLGFAGDDATEPGATPSPTPGLRSAPTAAPKSAPVTFTEELSGTALAIDLVRVDGGRVTFAVDGVEHTTDVAPFWIARTETPWELYDVFVFGLDRPDDADTAGDGADGEIVIDGVTRPSRPYVSPDRGYGHKGYATISVAYRGAAQFCTWLSAKTGRRYRLPTEAEWQLVCGQSGLSAATHDDHAWSDDNADFTPHRVGTKKPDALGLHDLWGNVREWCTGVDGRPVALGGSFIDPGAELGCTARAVPTPDWQMTDPQVPKSTWWLSDADFVGFRVVCEVDPPGEGGGDARE